MKKLMVTAMGAVLLASGGMYAVHGSQVEASAQKAEPSYFSQNGIVQQDVTQLPEYETLASHVELSKFSLRIVEDNGSKRVMVLKDANGRDQMKSMFMKEENRLKIVNFRGGLLFNGIIPAEDASTPSPEDQSNASESTTIINRNAQLPEYQALSASVDLTGYHVEIIDDNYNNRVSLFRDSNGHIQYKTIYVKKTGLVKIIKM
ncbi:hypothetical protein [Bacillus sp. S/N-304-OC-R1]|uniref:hypothetical protein n=1 Tax=Bacillus sp. S/N-304-OC-R1 TaxID=2758034 RepID=UPI001C8E7FD2|nr:hypothetical protein [Bacillus sp. S/N-304-OC-R1]MBY0123336.1 hypothetical protein [Bacillus sp. S/N-304-OC-R1]